MTPEEILSSQLKEMFPELDCVVVHASRRERERGLGTELHVTCAVTGQLALREGMTIAMPREHEQWDLEDLAAKIRALQ